MDLDLGIITEAEKRQKKKLLLDYLYANLKNHNFWAYRYFFCEFLALLNVLGKFTTKTKTNDTTTSRYCVVCIYSIQMSVKVSQYIMQMYQDSPLDL